MYLWKVGDLPKQNGRFKINLVKAKNYVFHRKCVLSMKPILEKYNLIPLINFAWQQSFAKVNNNKQAIVQRGWNPLNRALLAHPFILCTKDSNDDSNEENNDDSYDKIMIIAMTKIV